MTKNRSYISRTKYGIHYNTTVSVDKEPKFWQEYRPKCRPIPKDSKTAETDTETDISADTDTETDNFLSLVRMRHKKIPKVFNILQ
jgi:hypothetical protein